MDAIVLNGFNGIIDRLPWSDGIKDTLSSTLMADATTGSTATESIGMPCLQAVLFTSWFCLVLTAILLILCRMYPMVELDLVLDVTSISAHVDVLRCHLKSLQKVTVKAFGDYEEAELLPVFQELAELPELESFAADLRLPFHILSLVVKGAKKLKKLSLHFQLRDNNRDGDITTLIKSIRNHPSLTSIVIESCFYDAQLDINLDPLLLSVAEMQTVKSVSLYNLHCSNSVFSKMFQSSHLQSLEVSNIPNISKEQIEVMARNSSLKSLVAPIHPGTEEAWGRLVERNDALEELVLVVERTHRSHNPHRDVFIPVAKALGANKGLSSLTFDVLDLVQSTTSSEYGPTLLCVEAIASSIARNSTLKSLRLGHCSERLRTDREVLKHLVEAVRGNYTLERLEFGTGSSPSRLVPIPEIDFFLRCNRNGRGRILRSGATSLCAQMINFLIGHSTDTSMVYHLLLEKPEVILLTSNSDIDE